MLFQSEQNLRDRTEGAALGYDGSGLRPVEDSGRLHPSICRRASAGLPRAKKISIVNRMDETAANYRRLDAQKIIETVQALQKRIELRFPGSGLGKVVAELRRVAEETVARAEWIQKPNLPL